MERFTQKGLQMDRQAPLSLRGGRIPMVFENTLRRIVEEIGPGMADEELCALKQTMLTLLDFDPVPAEENDDGEEGVPSFAQIAPLLKVSCMSPRTIQAIEAMWTSVVSMSGDGAEERVNLKRVATLKRLLSYKVPLFTTADISRAQEAMDSSHEGLDGLKRFLLDAMRSAIVSSCAPRAILLVGPPGCGKTSLATSLASAFPERGHAVISLTGKDAAFELVGTDQGWRAATFGLILNAFVQAGSLAPTIVFDELDKVGTSDAHGRADAAFLDLLQPERAQMFTDSFMALPIDVSKAWFIFTANTLEGIPAPVLDRLSVFRMEAYTFGDMERIVRKVIAGRNARSSCGLRFTAKAVSRLAISRCHAAWSVRPMVEAVERVFASKAAMLLEHDPGESVVVDEDDVVEALGDAGYDFDLVRDFRYGCGVVTCICIGPAGGFLFPVEVKNRPSAYREVKVTGLVEDIMLESANIAYDLADSYLERNMMTSLGSVTVNYTYSFHKGGDSASLATALAIVSEVTGRAIPKTSAVTGAVSLKGNVLPVGGVVAKILAAERQGAQEVILPWVNRDEASQIPASIASRIRLTFVRTFDEAVDHVMPPVRPKEVDLSRGA